MANKAAYSQSRVFAPSKYNYENSKPLVSIGFAVYNGERYIGQALDSLIAQDYGNFELIISDNASTDATKGICEEYAHSANRIIYSRNLQNLGSGMNFFKVLEMAHGKYFMWAAHDDVWDKSYIRKCVDKLQEHPQAVMCCSEINFIDSIGNPLVHGGYGTHVNIGLHPGMSIQERVHELINRMGWYAFYGVWRTKAIRKIDFLSDDIQGYGGDVVFLLAMMLIGDYVKVDERLFYYRVSNKEKNTADYLTQIKAKSDEKLALKAYTYLASTLYKRILCSGLDWQTKFMIRSDFLNTLAYQNDDWLARIIRENFPQGLSVGAVKREKVIESFVLEQAETEYTKSLGERKKVLAFFPHNLMPPKTGAHRRCLDLLLSLKAAGHNVTLVSSSLYTDFPWTKESIAKSEMEYGIAILLHQGSEVDKAHIHAYDPKKDWNYYTAPSLVDFFSRAFDTLRPDIVFINYAMWGGLVEDKKYDDSVLIIEMHDLVSTNEKMQNHARMAAGSYANAMESISQSFIDEAFYRQIDATPAPSEFKVYDRFDIVTAIAPAEAALVRANTSRSETLTIPHVFKAQYCENSYSHFPVFVIGNNIFNFQGYAYFVNRVLPLVRAEVPGFILRMVGSAAKRLTPVPGIELVGFVPDLKSIYENASFAICPLIGGTGQQIKIVEAMSYGVPVVTLVNVAASSPVIHELNGFVAENAEEFARYMVMLLKNQELCRSLGNTARQTVFEAYLKNNNYAVFHDCIMRKFNVKHAVAGEQIMPSAIEDAQLKKQYMLKYSDHKVVIDGVIFQLQKGREGGISRVWKALIEELSRSSLASRIILLDRGETAPDISGIARMEVSKYDFKNHAEDSKLLDSLCAELGVDLFISTYYSYTNLFPNIIMLHDMTPERLGWDLSNREWQSKQNAIAKASYFLSVSYATLNDFRMIYPNQSSKPIEVITNAASNSFCIHDIAEIKCFKERFSIPKPYFLIVGQPWPHKNLILFFKAFSRLPKKDKYEIVVSGGSGRLQQEFSKYLDSIACHEHFFNDSDLSIAYSGAIALVYPSLYEGFGLPLLEAMQSGCPVITCRNSSIPEVVGDAALYVAESDVEGMMKALIKVQQKKVRTEMIKLGKARARLFSWEKSGTLLINKIEEIQQHIKVALESFKKLQADLRNHSILEIISAYEDFLTIYPSFALAHNELGILYSRSGDKEKAVQHYEAAVSEQPTNITFLKNLADSYYALQKDINMALQVYKKALSLNPEDVEILKAIGNIFIDKRQLRSAKDFYKRILEIDPKNLDALKSIDFLNNQNHVMLSEQTAATTIEAVSPMDEYLVSAIVSTYNSERFIRGCLEDLENQTISDKLEIIVVDSRSQQGEHEIVNEMQKKYRNIVYIRTAQRETVYASWNRGIKAASGKYITNANTDDRHAPCAFEKMIHTLEDYPDISLVYANVWITEKENETFENFTPAGRFCWKDFDPMTLIDGCYIGPQPMWRKTVHDKYGYFNEKFHSAGDWEFWLRMAKDEKFLHLNEFLGLYLKSPTSIEHRDLRLSREEASQIHKQYSFLCVGKERRDTDAAKKMYQNAQMLVEKGMDNAAIKALKELLISYPEFALAHNDLGVLYYKAGKKEDAFEHYKKAAELQPENINFQKNLVQEAIEIYVKILSLNPRDIECLLMLGHISLSIEKVDDSKVFYSKVLEVDPNNADARQNLESIQNYEQGTAV